VKIVVQKFGGTSIATAESRRKALKRIIEAKEQGFAPVVVVSAMGRRGEPYATDTLMDLVKSIYNDVEPRELDLMISCGEIISSAVMATLLKSMGHPAVALTGRDIYGRYIWQCPDCENRSQFYQALSGRG